MFLKCRSRANENESPRTERGFFSKKPIYKILFQFVHICFYLRDIGQSLSDIFPENFAQNRAESYYFCPDRVFSIPGCVGTILNEG
jgi:hypothetical protein